MKQFILVTTLLASTTLNSADAAGFNQFVGFGDSTLDTGYFRYHTTGNALYDQALVTAIAKGAAGGWAGNGVMNTTILAGKFGLSAEPIGGGGTNYAVGGATTIPNNAPVLPAEVTTLQQIHNYLTSVNGAANSNALYIIKTGDNDATYYTRQGPGFRAAHPNYLNDGAAALAVEVARLQEAGARTIVVRNSYDSALFAGPGGSISSGNADAYARTLALGTSEWSNLAGRGVNFVPVDNDSLFKYVATNPTLFGFTASSVLAANAPASGYTALLAILTPAQQHNFLFIDGVHLTTAGQTIEADYTYSLLAAPSQVSLVAEGNVQGGLARIATIQGQIDLSGQHRGPSGVNVWGSFGANNLKVKNASGFSDASGTPFGGTVGVDYRTPGGIIVGAAFTGGSQNQGFSTGGYYDQVDETPSLYAAYKTGAIWGNAVASYGFFQNNIARQVTLGTFTDQNHANTAGQSPALALRGGTDLKLRQITTGPVAGLVLQQVYLNGFTETGASGVTALRFSSQTRDSLITQLGWRVLGDLGNWQPFVEAKWNHEWAGKDRMITASLTSVAAPSYSIAAAPMASDWSNVLLGTSYKFNSHIMLRGAFSTVFLNPQIISYGGELGLNVSF
jgi:outer membrane lipase/esterase